MRLQLITSVALRNIKSFTTIWFNLIGRHSSGDDFLYSLVTFVICSFISQVGPRPCIYLTCEHLNVSWILAAILDERWRVKVYAWMISRNQLTECHTQIISEEFYIRFQARVDYQFMATNVFPCANWVKWNQHSNGRYLELASIVE